MLHWIQSVLHYMCSSSFSFLQICQYDISLVWFDFNVFGCVHNPLQVFVKVAEQDTALTLWKKQHVIILSPHSSYSIKAKKIAAMTNFQSVNANQLRANIVNALAWYSIVVLEETVPSSSTHTVKFIGKAFK